MHCTEVRFASLLSSRYTSMETGKSHFCALIGILWSDLTFKQQSSRIYHSADIPVLLLSTLFYSEVALDCLQNGKSRNLVA